MSLAQAEQTLMRKPYCFIIIPSQLWRTLRKPKSNKMKVNLIKLGKLPNNKQNTTKQFLSKSQVKKKSSNI